MTFVLMTACEVGLFISRLLCRDTCHHIETIIIILIRTRSCHANMLVIIKTPTPENTLVSALSTYES